jgi:hypothetical protein
MKDEVRQMLDKLNKSPLVAEACGLVVIAYKLKVKDNDDVQVATMVSAVLPVDDSDLPEIVIDCCIDALVTYFDDEDRPETTIVRLQ